jgi:alpha-L-rhamnosidase
LDYVTASYQSVRGEISSAWKKREGCFLWNITVPGNATATVYVPATSESRVLESGVEAASAAGVRFVKMDGAYAVFEVGSGSYNFITR